MDTLKGGGVASDISANRPKRLPEFIAENTSHIIGEWEAFARTLTPASTGMTPLSLRDHIHQILEFIVDDMRSPQSPREQTKKSHGKQENDAKSAISTAAETHAALRLAGGFGIDQMVSEYRALRASVVKLWGRSNPLIDTYDLSDLTRFNESIDQVLAESVIYYALEIVRSKDLFVGILSHDLRAPVHAIMLSAELTINLGALSERQTMLVRNCAEAAERIKELINNLLDVTRARFGTVLPTIRAPMDIGFVGHQIVNELRIQHSARKISLDVSGNTKGTWDTARIGQVFSNLLGNAIQYSFKETIIAVAIVGDVDAVEIIIHTSGVPIAADKTSAIFDPLTRVSSDPQNQSGSANLGLGLFITKEIVDAHGGTIHVTSSEEDGTTFTVRLPRRKPAPTLHIA
jgi:signal transduction histidine kinase